MGSSDTSTICYDVITETPPPVIYVGGDFTEIKNGSEDAENINHVIRDQEVTVTRSDWLRTRFTKY